MKKNNELIKLDAQLLEQFNDDGLMVIRGGKVTDAEVLETSCNPSVCVPNNCLASCNSGCNPKCK